MANVHSVVSLTRMKCLEFLYFYLIDETGVPTANPIDGLSSAELDTPSNSVPSSPTSPTDRFKPNHCSKPSMSSLGSRDTSNSSIFSAISNASTSATSLPSVQNTPKPSAHYSPDSDSPTPAPRGPFPSSSRLVTPPSQRSLQPRNLMLLKKDVDYTPQSPKKAQIAGLGVGTPRSATPMRMPSKLRAADDILSSEASETDDASDPLRGIAPSTPRPKAAATSHKRAESSLAGTPSASKASTSEGARTPVPLSKHRRARSELDVLGTPSAGTPQGRATSSGAVLQRASHRKATYAKTTEEKKELLGTLLGNVDALVASVRQQGIWGLG